MKTSREQPAAGVRNDVARGVRMSYLETFVFEYSPHRMQKNRRQVSWVVGSETAELSPDEHLQSVPK
jgi:hypothetical protein